MNNIWLIGFMAVGKSTVGKELSMKLRRPFLDSDACLVMQEKMEIPEIFEQYGEAYFRDAEAKCIRKLADEKEYVIACGGGVALREENVSAMKQGGRIVLLEASPELILERTKNTHGRPLLEGKKTVKDISEMMEGRLPFYRKAADVTINVDGRSSSAIAEEIKATIHAATAHFAERLTG